MTITRLGRISLLALLIALLAAAAAVAVPPHTPLQAQERSIPPSLLTPHEVVSSYPHDPDAFLQGLVWHDGGFYESTGLYGESTVRRVAFPSGEVLRKIDVPKEYFGEGLTMVGDRLFQLTWRSKKGFVYDRDSFGLLGEFPYQTEGWGLTYDGSSLILSDGSDRLYFLDPETYQETRSLPVTLDGRPLRRLNELEWIRGEVWANVWQTDMIVRIDPATGQVVGVLDLAGLLPADRGRDSDDVLNGIAYDAESGRTFVSGKRWPLLFEIRVP
jgi:glutamine cyclotransferase